MTETPATNVPAVPAATDPPAPPAARKFDWRRPANSKMRKTALKIVALRLRGMRDAEIAPIVGLGGPSSVSQYLWVAGKNGWLDEVVTDPKDKLEYGVMHKVVRNMERALDAEDPERADRMAVEVAKGTIFKSYDQGGGGAAPSLGALVINVQMPEGAPVAIRAGTVGGEPAVIDGEVVRTEPEGRRTESNEPPRV